jgi:hypothetical protein
MAQRAAHSQAEATAAREPRLTSQARRGYLWVTLGFLAFSLAGHWLFAWWAYVDDARTHGQPIEVATYAVEVLRDTFENWQSEFLQLIWQVAGLAWLLHVGSPQSKEGEARIEAKVDYLMSQLDGGDARRRELDQLYLREAD